MGFFGGGGSGGGYPPVTSSTGAVQVGFSGGDALGTNAINIQGERDATTKVASGGEAIAIGSRSTSSNFRNIAIGINANASGLSAIAIAGNAQSSGEASTAVGYNCIASQSGALALGYQQTASAINATAIGGQGRTASLRGQFLALSFQSVYWSGSTTNATPTILNLDGTATNRFTIAANTAVIANLYIIARRTDTVDKWFSGQRKVAIRRNNANGTAIIGSVETIGADQTEGSPTWSVAITADDTNEALQVEVTGAASETVSWRVMAFYHVV